MIKRIKNLFGQRKISTAKSISNMLSNDGILEGNITSRHVLEVYSSLIKIESAPAGFTAIKEILPKLSNKQISKSEPVFGVIVETREHFALEFVVNNFIQNIKIPVQLFHGNNNLNFIMSTSIGDLVREGKVHLTELNISKLDASKYNTLFLTKEFWQSILGRDKILVFQTDTVSCRDSDYSVNDFISYDYIGSKWEQYRPVGLIIDGGSGGLSLRDWSKSYECLSRFPPKYWCGGEDGYFAFHIDLIGGKVAKGNECAKFSTQEKFLFKSWGGHQISCLNKKDKIAFLHYCQEAEFMS